MARIRIKRGFKAKLPDLLVGELAFCFDTQELFIGTKEGNVLVNESEFISIDEKGQPNGIAPLDSKGHIPASYFVENIKALNVVETIADRDALEAMEGQRVHVRQAYLDDSSVTGEWAEYLYDGTKWVKTAERESLDVVLEWNNIQGRPSTFPPSSHEGMHDTEYLRRDANETLKGNMTLNKEMKNISGYDSSAQFNVIGTDTRASLISTSDSTYGSVFSLAEVDKTSDVFTNAWYMFRNTSEVGIDKANSLNFVFGTKLNASGAINDNGSLPNMRLLPEGKLELFRNTAGDIVRLVDPDNNTDVGVYIGNNSESAGYRLTYHGSGMGNENDITLQSTESNKTLLHSHQDGVVNFPEGLKRGGHAVWDAGNFNPENYLKRENDIPYSVELGQCNSGDGARTWVKVLEIELNSPYMHQHAYVHLFERNKSAMIQIQVSCGGALAEANVENVTIFGMSNIALYNIEVELCRKIVDGKLRYDLWVRTNTWGDAGAQVISSYNSQSVTDRIKYVTGVAQIEKPSSDITLGYDWSMHPNYELYTNDQYKLWHQGNLNPSDYFTKTGGDITGYVNLHNAISLRGKQTDGTNRHLLSVNGSDKTIVGSYIGQTEIESLATPRWSNGANSYKLLDERGGEVNGLEIKDAIPILDLTDINENKSMRIHNNGGNQLTIRDLSNNKDLAKFQNGNIEFDDKVWINSSSPDALSLNSSGSDHGYIQFFTDATNPTVRSGYFGYGSPSNPSIIVKNERSGGTIQMDSENGIRLLHNNAEKLRTEPTGVRITDRIIFDAENSYISYKGRDVLLFRGDGLSERRAVLLNANGAAIIGSGESAEATYLNGGYVGDEGHEALELVSDHEVKIRTAIQYGWDSRKDFEFRTNGDLFVPNEVKIGDNFALQYSIGGDADVDALGNTQLYAGTTANMTNKPSITSNANALLNIHTHAGAYYSQMWFDTKSDDVMIRSIFNGDYRNWNTLYHSGNLPKDSYDSHLSDSTIHKNWGHWSTNHGQDLLGRGKRALVATADTAEDTLIINYGGDFSGGVSVQSKLYAHSIKVGAINLNDSHDNITFSDDDSQANVLLDETGYGGRVIIMADGDTMKSVVYAGALATQNGVVKIKDWKQKQNDDGSLGFYVV